MMKTIINYDYDYDVYEYYCNDCNEKQQSLEL